MADPTKYVPGYNFSGFQAVNPNRPLPANSLDAEFAALMASMGEAVEAIKDVRRADGRLQNGSVGPDQLSAALSIGFTNRGTWASGVSYAAGDGVGFGSMFYSARVAHVSTGATQPDLDPTTWRVLFSFASISLADGSINTAKYADLSVTTSKIAAKAVTLPKMADIAATAIIGRASAGTGTPEALTPAQVRGVLSIGWEQIQRTKAAAGTAAITFANLSGFSRLRLSGFIRPSDANAIPALQAMNGAVVDSGASRYRTAGFASVAPAGGGAGSVVPTGPLAENSMRLAGGGMSNVKLHSLNFVADFVTWDDPSEFLVNIDGTYLDVPANTITFKTQGAYIGGTTHDGLRIACNVGTMTADLLLEGLRA